LNQKSVIDALQVLAKDRENCSNTAKMRTILPEIESTLKAGVSLAQIHKTLRQYGYTFSFRGFQSALYRIRRERHLSEKAQETTRENSAR